MSRTCLSTCDPRGRLYFGSSQMSSGTVTHSIACRSITHIFLFTNMYPSEREARVCCLSWIASSAACWVTTITTALAFCAGYLIGVVAKLDSHNSFIVAGISAAVILVVDVIVILVCLCFAVRRDPAGDYFICCAFFLSPFICPLIWASLIFQDLCGGSGHGNCSRSWQSLQNSFRTNVNA